MFTVLSTKETDLAELKAWMLSENINYDTYAARMPFSMILRIKEEIQGLIIYQIINDQEAELICCFVSEKARGAYFGDTLIRSVMNLLDYRGLKSLYAPEDHMLAPFLKHIAFELTTVDGADAVWRVPNIQAYFARPCKGH